MIKIIVAMDQNHVIGNSGGLPWSYPEDLKHFKKMTTGGKVLMGRKTFESIHIHTKGEMLPGREMVIASRYMESAVGAEVTNDYNECLKKYRNSSDNHIWVIGGSEIYKGVINYADELYVTIIKKDYKGDAYFPNIDSKVWKISEFREGSDSDLLFIKFVRNYVETADASAGLVNDLTQGMIQAIYLSNRSYTPNMSLELVDSITKHFQSPFYKYLQAMDKPSYRTDLGIHNAFRVYYDIVSSGFNHSMVKIIAAVVVVVKKYIAGFTAYEEAHQAIYGSLTSKLDKCENDKIRTEALLCQSSMKLGC